MFSRRNRRRSSKSSSPGVAERLEADTGSYNRPPAVPTFGTAREGWPSGRRRQSRKLLSRFYRFRGFKSHPLRQASRASSPFGLEALDDAARGACWADICLRTGLLWRFGWTTVLTLTFTHKVQIPPPPQGSLRSSPIRPRTVRRRCARRVLRFCLPTNWPAVAVRVDHRADLDFHAQGSNPTPSASIIDIRHQTLHFIPKSEI